jgi:hypothetical protein
MFSSPWEKLRNGDEDVATPFFFQDQGDFEDLPRQPAGLAR